MKRRKVGEGAMDSLSSFNETSDNNGFIMENTRATCSRDPVFTVRLTRSCQNIRHNPDVICGERPGTPNTDLYS